jgi:hypothetical protein
MSRHQEAKAEMTNKAESRNWKAEIIPVFCLPNFQF